MLREFVINEWVHVSSELALENGRRMVKWHVLVWGEFCLELGSNAEKWSDHSIERGISL